MTAVLRCKNKAPLLYVSDGIVQSDKMCYWIGSHDEKFQYFHLLSHNMSKVAPSCQYPYIRAMSDRSIMSDNVVDLGQF